MQVVNTPPDTAHPGIIDSAFYVLDAAELNDPTRRVPYPVKTLKAMSPEHWALMELRNADDLVILEKCYSAFPALSENWLDFRRELHMTDDKDLFMEKEAPGLLPLYQGKMVWQFNPYYDQPDYWLDPAAFDKRLMSKELHRMAQDLGVPKTEVAKHVGAVRYDREYLRLGVREIARDTDERTLIFSLLPKNIGIGHKVNYGIPKTYVLNAVGQVAVKEVSALRLLFALAWFNSVPLDWIARFMIQITVSKTYLYRLPMPQPSDDEIRSNPVYAQLAKNALLLTLAAPSPKAWDDFGELAPLFDVQKHDVPYTAKAQDILRAQNDKLVAQLYGITDAELAHLLRSFKVMAHKRPEYVALLQ
jgi:hypothetical protein